MISVRENFDLRACANTAAAFGLSVSALDRCFVLCDDGKSGIGLMALIKGEVIISAFKTDGGDEYKDFLLRSMLYALTGLKNFNVIILPEGDYNKFGFIKTARGWENASQNIVFPHFCKGER